MNLVSQLGNVISFCFKKIVKLGLSVYIHVVLR